MQRQAMPDRGAAPRPQPLARPLRVLLVEDSRDDAELVLRALRRGGYDAVCERVDTAPAMVDALNRRRWNIVISDHEMPRFSAPAALAILHEHGLDLPFIIVSGMTAEDVAAVAMKTGAHDYVAKDNLAGLVPAVERGLRAAQARLEYRRAAAAQQEEIQVSLALARTRRQLLSSLV